jgi:uncharacterized protein (DUF2164 family)
MINATIYNNHEVLNANQYHSIMNLIDTSTFDTEQRNYLLRGLDELTPDEADILIGKLLANQLDRITSGMSYNQGDIKEHMAKVK